MNAFDFIRQNPIVAVIIGCEIGLWLALFLGLALRYLLRLKRTSTVMLAAIPLLDVVLLIAVAIDMAHGAQLSWVHTAAAYYLGFSVAFGPALVRYVDVRFAHRFAGGPAPTPKPKYGKAKQQALWQEWYRVVLAATIASAVSLALIVFFADAEAQQLLWWSIGRIWFIVGLWFLFGPMIKPKPEPKPASVSPGAEAGSSARLL